MILYSHCRLTDAPLCVSVCVWQHCSNANRFLSLISIMKTFIKKKIYISPPPLANRFDSIRFCIFCFVNKNVEGALECQRATQSRVLTSIDREFIQATDKHTYIQHIYRGIYTGSESPSLAIVESFFLSICRHHIGL